ncbi:MAG: hypothetical protein MR480_00285 [Eubacterium coprostanoligenes]|uniref:hypothetical protein n=1 Tax=Eubacterium coprostanoligenes TaxID=290054 RepID=UPI0023575FF1|nr:hypothetical protein [Eubacterium coprostanoligenes]MCI7264083.1 hypothetical protein [Eubacterium coprostanoligenes]
MTNNILKIGKPTITKTDNGKVRLQANIICPDFEKDLYFEVEDKYKSFLCTEVIDAFVLGIYYYASYYGFDIHSEYPVSARIKYQINKYFSPISNKMNSVYYKKIKLVCPTIEIDFNPQGVGASVSGGVDSFYSLLSHYKDNIEDYKITHILVANLFNYYSKEDEINRNHFKKLSNDSKLIADNLELPVISMYTNHHEFFFPGIVGYYSFRICSYALALQKLFKVYLLSSGTMTQDINFFSPDSSDYDLFNTQIASNNNITFYMSGGEAGRIEKIKYISDYEVVKKYLHVCTLDDEKNCTVCSKCMRTATALDMYGKLTQYSDLFDLKSFYKNKNKYWSNVYASYNDPCYGTLNTEYINEAKKIGYKVSPFSKIYGILILNTYLKIKSTLKKSAFLKTIYYKLNLDYLIYGKEKATIYRYDNDIPRN